MSLQDFNNNVKAVSYLWISGVGQPSGQAFNHNIESDGDDYCDMSELLDTFDFWSLEGEIDEQGYWIWSGKGNPTDVRGNTIQRIVAA